MNLIYYILFCAVEHGFICLPSHVLCNLSFKPQKRTKRRDEGGALYGVACRTLSLLYGRQALIYAGMYFLKADADITK